MITSNFKKNIGTTTFEDIHKEDDVKSNLNFSNLDDSFKEFDDYLHFRKNFEDEHNESYLLNFDLLIHIKKIGFKINWF